MLEIHACTCLYCVIHSTCHVRYMLSYNIRTYRYPKSDTNRQGHPLVSPPQYMHAHLPTQWQREGCFLVCLLYQPPPLDQLPGQRQHKQPPPPHNCCNCQQLSGQQHQIRVKGRGCIVEGRGGGVSWRGGEGVYRGGEGRGGMGRGCIVEGRGGYLLTH